MITDLLMPVMDGYELVRQLRLDPATSGIPVVFYTAHLRRTRSEGAGARQRRVRRPDQARRAKEVLKIVGRALSGESGGHAVGRLRARREFDREHLRLLTDKLSEKAGDLRAANARLRALINIGLELASERDSERLLQNVCAAARDLFGATYVTLGIVDLAQPDGAAPVEACGADAAPGSRLVMVWGSSGRWSPSGGRCAATIPAAIPAACSSPCCHPNVQAFLAAPIASPTQVYGWICLVANEGRTFTEDDEQMVVALSGQVGRIHENGYFHLVANKRAAQLEHEILERVRAEEETRRRAQLSALGAAIGLSLIDADVLAHALQRCAEAIVTHLGVAFVRIWTLNEGEGMLEMQASAGLHPPLWAAR